MSTGIVLVTGGAGFIGANVAHRLLSGGRRVRILDNLSRPGAEKNLRWLCGTHGDAIEVVVGDIRNPATIEAALDGVDHVYHFAAQVAVTTSLEGPSSDFDVNARGTLNVLEGIRTSKRAPSLVYTSTNKVYGDLGDVPVRAEGDRYMVVDPIVREFGVGESRQLAFHSPYGCSKGAADQYVLDYAHTFGLRAVVFRMSCIYGQRQFGNEDQGWLAHFVIRALRREPIVVYGDGRQVRDVLFVDDLVDAMLRAEASIGTLSGSAFNMGGGPRNTLSLLELLQGIERRLGRSPEVTFEGWRVADQRHYVSDTRAFERRAGWSARVGVEEGMDRLVRWAHQIVPFAGVAASAEASP